MDVSHYSSPLRVGAAVFFFLSILHTFCTPFFYKRFQICQHKKMIFPEKWRKYLWLSESYRLLSSVDVIFIFWSVPLFLWFLYSEGYAEAIDYFNHRNYLFALFIMIMLILLESRPIVYLSECIFLTIAKIGKQSPKCWWWTLMLGAPFSAILLKETGAMIIAATLLVRYFYKFAPSLRFSYATMGLLFSNISVGGLITDISSRALLLVSPALKGEQEFVIRHFSWKAVIAIFLSTTTYYLMFRKEFDHFPKVVKNASIADERVPIWLICLHVLFVAAIMSVRSVPLLMIGILILYLGLHQFTIFYQNSIRVTKVCCVGLFYAGLLILGGLQEWWMLVIMHRMSDFGYMFTSYILSMFLDNVLVNYLVHNLSVATDCFLYLVIAGCMSAGGVTILANAPNIVGYLIIKPFFPTSPVSLGRLFVFALGPSLIALMTFWALKDIPSFMFCFFR